jgi:predicted nuclease of predicted toxin-antitoxin system
MSTFTRSRSKPALLADENFPKKAIQKLYSLGYDIKSIAEIKPGIVNGAVAQLAQKENRILLTFDKDFGEMVVQKHTEKPIGVILFRLRSFNEEQLVKITVDILNKEHDLSHHFVVVQENQIRVIPL